MEKKKVAILEKAGLSSGGYSKLNDINLVLRAGEISGICGVEGNGQNEIVDILLQLLSVENGTAELNYSSVSVVPDDRIKKRYDQRIYNWRECDHKKNGV